MSDVWGLARSKVFALQMDTSEGKGPQGQLDHSGAQAESRRNVSAKPRVQSPKLSSEERRQDAHQTKLL